MVTEDEAFEELEHRLKEKQTTDYIQRAQIEAARFLHDHKDELGMMTLRKAFELGYRYGYSNGTDSRTK
jgi:hypothetical protein